MSTVACDMGCTVEEHVEITCELLHPSFGSCFSRHNRLENIDGEPTTQVESFKGTTFETAAMLNIYQKADESCQPLR